MRSNVDALTGAQFADSVVKPSHLNLQLSSGDLSANEAEELLEALEQQPFMKKSLRLEVSGLSAKISNLLKKLDWQVSLVEMADLDSAYIKNATDKMEKAVYLKNATMASEAIAELQTTRSFSATFFESHGFGLQHIPILADALVGMPHLRKLSLSILDAQIGDEGLQQLSKALGKLGDLEDLILRFRFSKAADAGARSLAKALTGLKKLNRLNLGFYQSKIGSEGLQSLTTAIGSLPDLSRLSFDIGGNEALYTHKAADSCTQILKPLEQLKQLQEVTFYLQPNGWNWDERGSFKTAMIKLLPKSVRKEFFM